MLKVYNPSNAADVIPLPIDDDKRYVTHKYNGYDTLNFEIESNNPLYRYIVEEAKIEDEKNSYVIKHIDEHSNFATVRCDINIDDWKANIFYEYRRTRYLLSQVLEEILPEGWSISWECTPPTKRTTIEGNEGEPMRSVTPLEILQEAAEVWSVVFNFKVFSKTLVVIDPSTYITSGIFFTDEINLKSVGFVGSSDGYATRLYAFGAKDSEGNPMTFADINDGKPYVEDYTYSNKIVCVGWTDERYTVKENLLAAAKQRLSQISAPSRSYDCDACDLKDKVWMYKVVTLIDRVRRTRVDHQIVEWKEYPNSQLDTITLSKTAPNVQSFVSEIRSEIDSITKDNDSTLQGLINEAVNKATEKITGSKGGNFMWVFDSEGRPVELVNLADSMDINTAKSVWRWNAEGLGHSNDGYNGAMTLALLADGSINANVITSGKLTANIIKAGTLSDVNGNTEWNLETGELISKKLSITSENFKLTEDGTVNMKNAEVGGTIRSWGKTKYDILGYYGTIVEQGKIEITSALSEDNSDTILCGYIEPAYMKAQVDEYIKGIKIGCSGYLTIEDTALPDGHDDTILHYTSFENGHSYMAIGNYETGIFVGGSTDIYELQAGCNLVGGGFKVEGDWAYSGDLPVSSGYDYTIHVVGGIITGWS